jgi:hypothetical protein
VPRSRPNSRVQILSYFLKKLTYLINYLLIYNYNQFEVRTCQRSSFHSSLSLAQSVSSGNPRARLSQFTPSAYRNSVFLAALFLVIFGISDHGTSAAQPICLHDVDDSPLVHNKFETPFSQRRVVRSAHFKSTPMPCCHITEPGTILIYNVGFIQTQ